MQTLENICAIRIETAVSAMRSAADALAELKTREARQHAKEMRCAALIAAEWARQLKRRHSSTTPTE